jgi:hypothetical protein
MSECPRFHCIHTITEPHSYEISNSIQPYGQAQGNKTARKESFKNIPTFTNVRSHHLLKRLVTLSISKTLAACEESLTPSFIKHSIL